MQLKFINAFGRGPNTPSKRSFHDSNAKNSSGPQAAREPPPNTPLRWQRRGAQERTCLRGRQLTIRHREVSPSVKYRAAWSTSFFDLATAQGRALSSLLTSEAQRLVFPTMRRHASTAHSEPVLHCQCQPVSLVLGNRAAMCRNRGEYSPMPCPAGAPSLRSGHDRL